MDTALILASGDGLGPQVVDELPPAELIVAADGGYDLAVALGLKVDLLVGDCISLVSPAKGVSESEFVQKYADAFMREHPEAKINVGGITVPEIVEQGLLVEPDNEETLAAAIRRLCAEPELRRSLATAGCTILARYDALEVGRLFLEEAKRLIR